MLLKNLDLNVQLKQLLFNVIASIGTFLGIAVFTFSYAQTTEVFDTPGIGQTWTVPCGVTSVTVELYGGGAGGGGSNTGGLAGGGGGAGGYTSHTFAVVPNTTFTFTVGAGGTGGGPAGNGAPGSQTNWSAPAMFANGGTGGLCENLGGTGGAGGTSSGWTLSNSPGGPGSDGGAIIGGFGGDAAGPNGGAGGIGGPAGIDGSLGTNYGAGGGGGGDKEGAAVTNGGAGAPGAIIITYTTTITQPNAGPDQNICAITNLSGNTPDIGWTATWAVVSGAGTVATPNDPNSGIGGITAGNCSTFEWRFSSVGCPDFVDYVTICEPVICNDDPCGATPLTVGSSCSFSTYNNIGATNSTGMVEPGCGQYDDNDVWFSAVVPANGQLEINAVDAPGGSSMYMGISIYTGTCDNLAHAGCDWSNVPTTQAELSFLGTPGQTVYIRVHNYFDYEDNFQICAHSTPNAAGDIFPGATSVTCGTPMTFMDPGGTGNYQLNSTGQYVLCPDTPGQYVSIDFSSGSNFFDIENGYDKLTILDGSTNSAPIIGQYTGTTNPGVITSSAPDGCLTIVFASDNIITDLGWLATVSCSPTAGTNSYLCSSTNCSGECGQWICADGLYPTNNNGNGVEDLSVQTSGCFGAAGEIASQWFYFTVENSGTIEFTFDGPNGQDYDFAVWGPSTDGVPPCPMNTNEGPIVCSFAAVSNTGNPVGINAALGGGESFEGAEGDGWVDALQTTAGETYAMLLNIYMNGNPQPVIDLTIGGTGTLDCTPVFLPISLHSFSGINQGSKNLITWVTDVEVNNDYFTIERSINGVEWQIVGIQDAVGNSQVRRYYSMVDYQPYYPVTYYRLKQTDIDGEFQYSETIAINANRGDGSELISELFPNPATDYATFTYNGDSNEELMVQLLDATGSAVISKSYSNMTNGAPITLITEHISSGLYHLVVIQGEESYKTKLSIVH